MESKKLISIITPVLNEEENLYPYHERVCKVIDSLSNKFDFEIIFTDNASTDRTFEIIRELAKKDDRVSGYRFSRNFGYQNSIFTGYQKSKGQATIEFDCDLQDPPELLPKFIEQWEAGNQIVYGVRMKRQEGFFIGFIRKRFYRILNKISDIDLPHDAGDFMLLDRVIVNELKKVEDYNLYIRGIVFSFGFNKVGIPYNRDARVRGVTKFSASKLMQLAFNGIVSMSVLPLRIASYIGIVIAFVTLLVSFTYIVLRLTGSPWPAGFTTNVVLLLFSISLNALFLGIIGEYIARMSNQVKKRPITIISDEVTK